MVVCVRMDVRIHERPAKAASRPQCLEDGHLIERDLLRRRGQCGIDRDEAALRVEHAEKIQRARVVVQFGEPVSARVLGARGVECGLATPLGAIAGERLLGFLQCAQHLRIERRARGGIVRASLRELRAARREIRKTPRNQRPDAPRDRVLVAERRRIAGRRQPVHRPAEHDRRVQLGRRDADPCVRRGEPALAFAQVGPAPEQRGTVADRKRSRQRRRRVAARGRVGNRTGCVPGQHGEFIQRGAACACERGQFGARIVGKCTRARDFEIGHETVRTLPCSQRGEALGDRDRALGHVDPLAIRACLRIGGRRLGGHRDAHRIRRRLHGLRIGTRGIDEMADTPPEIDFPRQRERRRVTPAHPRIGALRARDDLVGRVLAVVDAEAGCRIGQPRGARFVEHGPRPRDTCRSHREIAVLRERFAHECVERRIVEQLPPAIGQRAAGRDGCVGRRVERRRARRIGRGWTVRIADRTGGKRRGAQQRDGNGQTERNRRK